MMGGLGRRQAAVMACAGARKVRRPGPRPRVEPHLGCAEYAQSDWSKAATSA